MNLYPLCETETTFLDPPRPNCDDPNDIKNSNVEREAYLKPPENNSVSDNDAHAHTLLMFALQIKNNKYSMI